MRRVLFVVILANFALMGWLVYKRANLPSEPQYLRTPQAQPIVSEPEIDAAVVEIEQINKINAQIKNFYCDKMSIRVKQKALVKLDGFLAWEKERKLRTQQFSILGKETDIGSNARHFWFWSRRMNPPALHYASHKDLHKTRLKIPFNPQWMAESLSMSEIDLKDASIVRSGESLAVLQDRVSTLNRPIIKITMVDPNRDVIIGHYIIEGDRLVVSSEVESFQVVQGFQVPSVINTIWYDEGVTVQWVFKEPRVNTMIDSGLWRMPDMRQKIDMGKEKGSRVIVHD
jgi:hypothetical protein